MVYRLPVDYAVGRVTRAGTTVTHAAMKACADSNTPVCWIGEDRMRFYAFGITPNHDNSMSRKHAAAWAIRRNTPRSPAACSSSGSPARMWQAYSIAELRAWRACVCAQVRELGQQYGVTWKGRKLRQIELESRRQHQSRAVHCQRQPLRVVRCRRLLARLPAVAGIRPRRRHAALHLRCG